MITSNVKLKTSQTNKVLPIIEKNYAHNLDSDYTEKIETLDKNFKYNEQKDNYWTETENSVFYGTPLYEQASESQRLSLNHLNWVLFYKKIADSEIEVLHYNTVTSKCLSAANIDYRILGDLLDHETAQERKHIHAFYHITYQTTKALLGKKFLINPSGADKNHKFAPKQRQFSNYLASAENLITKMLIKNQEASEDQNLKEGENVNHTFATKGFFNGLSDSSSSRSQFFSVNWSSYPFLAANFYAVRYIANLVLKNNEFEIHKYYRKLQKENGLISSPTTISHYHFLDEAFHTNTSLFLGRDFYQYLPKPSLYQKTIANLAVLRTQYENFNGVSGMLPNRFLNDGDIMGFLLKLLQSPIFDMSAKEALSWIEKCSCYEHEGFHLNLKYHNHLLFNLRKFAEQLDYLWPVNREMRIMASGGSIKKAIAENTRAFNKFMQTI